MGAVQNHYLKALRTAQMIESGIKAGKKFTTDDMIVLQDDLLDIVCKDQVPLLMAMVDNGYDRRAEFNLTAADVDDLLQVKSLLKPWDCRMTSDSIGATIYAYWQFQFQRRLLKSVTASDPFWTESRRLTLIDNPQFYKFLIYMIEAIAYKIETKGKIDAKFEIVCGEAFDDEYSGNEQCLRAIVKSFVEAKRFLATHFTSNPENWRYGKVHFNDLESLPWSMTPFRPIWHRRTSVPGSRYTVNYSRHSSLSLEKDKVMLATHFGDFRGVFGFGKTPAEDEVFMILNAGMGENPFAPNYFNMNADFYNSKIYKIETDFRKLLSSGHYVLEIKPLS